MTIDDLKREYEAQDNRSTAYPIYVSVQELVHIGVIADGYSVCCPFGDGENRTEYKHPDIDGSFENEEELIKALDEYYGEDEDKDKLNSEIANIEKLNIVVAKLPTAKLRFLNNLKSTIGKIFLAWVS